ncbi:hypothetical protein Pla108_37380 [Botrimarina colliarenosi]|uniref:Uncharacterized protein n=2 Tax=Botrimarina colliarenosi TaxID=2528001 RepID=A0A5C6A3V8_9BACT|nr:hypothetical protein Pla108_37380 [Botrimarina colliarenosi]
MAVGDLFRYARRAFFSKPTPERQLLRLAKQHAIRRVVEVGLESVDSTAQLLDLLVKQAKGEPVKYTALDLFDDRPAEAPSMPLVAAYRRLVGVGAKVRLTPGRLGASLASEANSLADTDLLLLSRDASDEALGPAWFYVPRMCHPGTLVLRRIDGEGDDPSSEWREIPLPEVAARANALLPRRRAA